MTPSACLLSIARLLDERAADLSRLMAAEMGKPVTQGLAEIAKCALVCRHYAEHGPRLLSPQPLDGATLHHLPLGRILAIMPWNFPFWQVFRFAAPALVAGNTITLKHASLVPGCARAIADLVRDATRREDLLTPVFLPGSEVESLIADPSIRAVTFTGSTGVGRLIAAAAGRHLKKTVLELGGSDPYLILDDADLPHAVAAVAAARMINAGQSCIAAKRFIVAEPLHRPFVEALRAELEKYPCGDPLLPSTRLGPLASPALRDELHQQVLRSVEKGARLVLGGALLEAPLPFYPATLLDHVRPGMPAFDEETFGPVAAVISARDDEEALHLANLSPFGLGAAIFTRDLDRAQALADRLEAGSVAINRSVVSDPRHPFGGIKDSGWGRELGAHGLFEFTNPQTRTIATPEG